MRISNEAKTGALVLACAVALGVVLFKVGKFNPMQKGYTVRTQLHFIGGVKKNAPVRLSGVDVGQVEDIRVLYGDDTLVELDLWLRDDAKIFKDSKAYVATLGLMGEKYIEIKAGSPASGIAAEGDLVAGEDPVRLEELIETGKKVAAQIGDTATKIGRTAEDISVVTKHVDEIVLENKPKIASMFDYFEETSENVRDFSEDIKYHPWKVLMKGKEKSKEEVLRDRAQRKAERARAKQAADAAGAASTATALSEAPAGVSPQAQGVSAAGARQNFVSGNKN